MKIFAILTTILAITLPFSSTFAKNSQKKIAFIENMLKYLSTEGNLATLYKTPAVLNSILSFMGN